MQNSFTTTNFSIDPKRSRPSETFSISEKRLSHSFGKSRRIYILFSFQLDDANPSSLPTKIMITISCGLTVLSSILVHCAAALQK